MCINFTKLKDTFITDNDITTPINPKLMDEITINPEVMGMRYKYNLFKIFFFPHKFKITPVEAKDKSIKSPKNKIKSK